MGLTCAEEEWNMYAQAHVFWKQGENMYGLAVLECMLAT